MFFHIHNGPPSDVLNPFPVSSWIRISCSGGSWMQTRVSAHKCSLAACEAQIYPDSSPRRVAVCKMKPPALPCRQLSPKRIKVFSGGPLNGGDVATWITIRVGLIPAFAWCSRSWSGSQVAAGERDCGEIWLYPTGASSSEMHRLTVVWIVLILRGNREELVVQLVVLLNALLHITYILKFYTEPWGSVEYGRKSDACNPVIFL
jgi:hypothetical protein